MIKGTYIFYENGKEINRYSNIITKFGKRFLTEFLAGNITNLSKDMAFGIDATSETANDTRLGFEFYRIPVVLTSTDIATSGASTTYSVVYKTTIPQDVVGVISEIGLYPSTRTTINNFDSKFLTDFDNNLDWYDSSLYNPTTVSNTGTVYSKVGGTHLKWDSISVAKEYKKDVKIDLSGYSNLDSIRLAYYKYDANVQNILIKFYYTNNDYYTVTITPASGTGYKISNDILMGTVFGAATGSVDKSQISKIGVTVTPTSSQTTSVGFDALRINDEDTFDPTFGLISRATVSPVITKLAGRQVDVEYKLDLDF